MQHLRTTAVVEEVVANGSDIRGDNQAEDYGKLQKSQLCVK